METMKELTALNSAFIRNHGEIDQYDIEKVLKIRDAVKKLDQTKINHLDIINLDGKNFYCVENYLLGDKTNRVSTCKYPSTHINENGGTSTSGGPFPVFDLIDLELTPTKGKRIVWTFGHCGATGGGAIYFEIEVKLWEVKNPKKYINEYPFKDSDWG